MEKMVFLYKIDVFCLSVKTSYVVLPFVLAYIQARAEITNPLKDTKVSEKEGRLTLDCGVKLEGIRPKWFKDGKEIQPSKKYRCLSSDHDAKLVVYDLAPGDKGNYEVQFADIAKSACKVTVERKLQLEWST